MAGDDRELIGRKGRPSRPTKQKLPVAGVREEDYDDEYDDDDYEDEKPVPRKGKKATVANLVVALLAVAAGQAGDCLRGADCRLWRLPRSENPQPH